jgi:hypothetical protein
MPRTDLPAQTSECVVSLYTVQLGLITRTSSKEEAERRVIRAMAVVRRLEQAGPRGMRYVVWFEHHFDEWLLEQSKLADSAGSRTATYTHPLRFEIIASDEHEAMERRDRLHAWLRTLMQRGLIYLGSDVELEAIEELPSPSFSGPLTIDPSLGPALYPYIAEWSGPAAVPDPDDESGDQAAKFLQWSSMSLKTDTQSDAVASLRLAVDTMGRVGSDIALWKWVVISLHNAVQGFMVLALEGDPLGSCDPGWRKRTGNAQGLSRSIQDGQERCVDETVHDQSSVCADWDRGNQHQEPQPIPERIHALCSQGVADLSRGDRELSPVGR